MHGLTDRSPPLPPPPPPQATSRPLPKDAPRTVYRFFLTVHQATTAAGMAGYLMVLTDILGLGGVFWSPVWALTILFYGLYFGVLGRDCAEVAAERMTATMGYSRGLHLSVNVCALCGGDLRDYEHVGGGPAEERAVQLNCKCVDDIGHTLSPVCVACAAHPQLCSGCEREKSRAHRMGVAHP